MQCIKTAVRYTGHAFNIIIPLPKCFIKEGVKTPTFDGLVRKLPDPPVPVLRTYRKK